MAATLKAPQAPQVTARDICTGVTLGDGQVDWLLLGQLGKYIPQTRTFLRLIVPLRMAQNPWMFELESAPGLEREREREAMA